MAKRPLILLGAGGHAAVVAETADALGFKIQGHLSPEPGSDTLLGPHLGGDERIATLALSGVAFALGIGFVNAKGALQRARLLTEIKADLLQTLVHPTAFISPSAMLAPGVFIAPGAIVGTRSQLGLGSIVNTAAVVDHDCNIAENVHIATGAKLPGGVTIGRDCLIGAGSTLRQAITIGEQSVIGAGAVVVGNVPACSLMLGVPARAASYLTA